MLKLYDERIVERIIEASIEGLSAEKIRVRLALPITTRQVQRIIKSHRGPVPVDSHREVHDGFGAGALRSIVMQLLIAKGLDPHVCSICGLRQLKVCDLHHTKYDNATIHDVVFACRSCNLAREQKGLS